MPQDVAEGTIIRNPQTGERRILRGGSWATLAPAATDEGGYAAPGAMYLPTGPREGGRSADAYYNNWRQRTDPSVEAARTGSTQARRAEGLLEQQRRQAEEAGFLDPARYSQGGTGGIYGVPVIGNMMRYFDPEIRELEAIQAQAARANRQPGEGAISDFDAQQFLNMTYGPTQPGETNRALIRARREADDQVMQQRAFMEWFYDNYRELSGAQEAWDRYVQDNPIFDRASVSTGEPRLNNGRVSWREYFGAGGDARGTVPGNDLERAEGGGRGQYTIRGSDGRTHAITADNEQQAQELAGIFQRINPAGQRIQYFEINGERVPGVSEDAARLFVEQRNAVRRGQSPTPQQGGAGNDPLGIRQ